MSLDKSINNMPKMELHLHIEGSLAPERMFDLAQRNKVAIPFRTVDGESNIMAAGR